MILENTTKRTKKTHLLVQRVAVAGRQQVILPQAQAAKTVQPLKVTLQHLLLKTPIQSLPVATQTVSSIVKIQTSKRSKKPAQKWIQLRKSIKKKKE